MNDLLPQTDLIDHMGKEAYPIGKSSPGMNVIQESSGTLRIS